MFSVKEPFPIFKLAHRYVIYDPKTISYIREGHNICGVLIGGLAQAPQQNVFLGVPLELMPEEARVLIEKGVAFIEDDTRAHKNGFLCQEELDTSVVSQKLGLDERRAYQAALWKQGHLAALQACKKSEDRRKAALDKCNSATSDWNDVPAEMLRSSSNSGKQSISCGLKRKGRSTYQRTDVGSHRVSTPTPEVASPLESPLVPIAGLPASVLCAPDIDQPNELEPYAVTPTTSYPPLSTSTTHIGSQLSAMKSPSLGREVLDDPSPSYPLFKYLHSCGYFLAPGLRFGCQYLAYPGDPLRFHSHFLCTGMGWDEEFELLKLVGGGRLGTGVKKGFLIGGRNEGQEPAIENTGELAVRTLCIEWGGM